jgi:hypothetical protein
MIKLLIDESPLMVLPSLAERIGLDEAIVLQQVHYLVGMSAKVENLHAYKDGYYWVFNSIDQWQSKYFRWWSTPTVKRIFQNLTKSYLLITETFGTGKGHKRLWYRVNHDLVAAISDINVCDFSTNQNDRIKLIRSKWTDQIDPVVSDQIDPMKPICSDQFDPPSIYKNSFLLKEFHKEREEPPTPEVKVLIPKPINPETQESALEQIGFPGNQNPKSSLPTDNPSLEQKSPAPLANAETTADRVRRVYQGTGVLPKEPLEFEAWVQEDLGAEIISLYRQSGRIATTKRGDINPSFAKYVADQWKGKDIDYGYNSIRSMEREPQKWEVLASLVMKWQAATITGNSHINLAQEFNNQERTGPPQIDFGGRRI